MSAAGTQAPCARPGVTWADEDALRRSFEDEGGAEEHFNFSHSFGRSVSGKLTDYYAFPAWGGKLGEGACGTVRRAECRMTGAQRAVKSIATDKIKDQGRLEQEISILRQLDHPNVVRLYETFSAKAQMHLVMELCVGGELFDHVVRDGPGGFPEAKAAGYSQQMLEAICYVHAQRVAHRDVKPENFLLHNNSPDPCLKLADFGAARRFEPGGKPMTTMWGTAYYVAPEVLSGSYGERCDVWSIGVVTYVLLCGYTPFRGRTPPAILRKVRRASVQFVGQEWDLVSRTAKDYLLRLLDADASRRPSAKEALRDGWLSSRGPRPERTAGDLLDRMRSFQKHALLKQVAVTAVAQQVPDAEVETWRCLFKELDRDGDGLLSLEEVREGVAQQGLTVPEELEQTMRSIDSDGSGCLDYTEFLAATLDPKVYAQRDICRAAFRTLDLNRDGKISPEELRQMFTSGGGGKSPGDCEIAELLEAVDLNGDGVIDFEEFFAMMRARRSLHYSRPQVEPVKLPGALLWKWPRLRVTARVAWLLAGVAVGICGGCSFAPAAAELDGLEGRRKRGDGAPPSPSGGRRRTRPSGASARPSFAGA